MKKILFMLILLIPYIIYAEYDESKVTIESFTLVDTEGYGKELSNPTIDNNGISFNIQVSNKGDSVTYQLVIKNESGEDVELYNRSSADDYVKYILISPTSDYVVKNGQENSFQIKAIYDSPISTTLLQSNNYTNSYTYSLEVSNELGKQDMIHALADVPDTVDNPNTNATLNYVITIASIAFVISIGLWLNIRKKNNIGKVFIIIGMIGIITPIIVYAFNEFKLNLKANVTITKPIQPVCKKATTLRTEKCATADRGCSSYIGLNNTITYGTIPNGKLKAGDAYDCDVNYDGVYDSENERFYYVSDYYDGLTNTFDSTKAVLIHNKHLRTFVYSTGDQSSENWHGPTHALHGLPKKSVWSNPGIIPPTNRVIRNELGTNTTNNGLNTIENFSYTESATRLLTYQEVAKGCGITGGVEGELDNSCNFFFDNILSYYSTGYTSDDRAFYLETPISSSKYYVVSINAITRQMDMATFTSINATFSRPAITIDINDLEHD